MSAAPPPRHVAWTGHRPELFADPAAAAAVVAARAEALCAEHRGAVAFHCGGQRGVDTWAAQAAMRLGVPLHLYLPLPIPLFAADWTPADRAALEATWEAAATRTVVDPTGADPPAAYRARNALLARRADLLVAVWTGLAGGGTAETLAFARALGRPIEEHVLPRAPYTPAPGARGV
ncbi:MAG TPA: hypothetical protein VKZ60_17340 [Chloroflexota bacterium]|nr:hypothetical protein [Chloroflexota bacterium]